MEEIDGRVIILILFVVISAFKWLVEKIKGPVAPPSEEHEISKSIENLYDDFREEIRHRQTKTQRPEQPTPPPLPPTPAPTPQAQAPPIQQASTKKPANVILSDEQKAAAARFQQRSTSKPKTSPQSYVKTLLSSPQATRQAIILTEILGKPKSLQNG